MKKIIHNLNGLTKSKTYLIKQNMQKITVRQTDVFGRNKRSNIYFSFFFQLFINDLFKKGKMNKVAKLIYKGFAEVKETLPFVPLVLQFYIYEKSLIPFENINLKRGRNIIVKQKPLPIIRQLILTRRMLVRALESISECSLDVKLKKDFVSIATPTSTILDPLLANKFVS